MNRPANQPDPLAPLRGKLPRGWEAWMGVTGTLYARWKRSSPPIVVRADTAEELAEAIRQKIGEQQATTTSASSPRMTKAELAGYQIRQWGRDYRESDDGYSDMAAEEARGWHAVANWGRDGWDLGNWPYVIFYVRNRGGRYELLEIVEGDRTLGQFSTPEERERAINYLFLWYAAGERWGPLSADQREALEIGYPLAIDAKWAGPCQS